MSDQQQQLQQQQQREQQLREAIANQERNREKPNLFARYLLSPPSASGRKQ